MYKIEHKNSLINNKNKITTKRLIDLNNSLISLLHCKIIKFTKECRVCIINNVQI